MSMEICRACGSFLMPTWDRCRICGHDPGEALPGDADGAPAGGTRGRGGSKAGPPGSEPDDERRGRTIAAMLAVAAAIIALYIGWYLPNQEGGRETAVDVPAPTTSTSEPSTTTTTGSTTTTAAGGTTTSTAGGSTTTLAPGDLRLAFAAAMTQLASEAYPLDGDGWPCAGLLAVDAVGGPSAIQERGLEPADFSTGQVGGRLRASDSAIDEIATGLPDCEVDMVDLLAVQLAATNEASVVDCIEEELDRTIANRALARQLTGDIDAMSPESPFFEQVVSAATSCGG
jgi:hypothetical protein